MKSKMHALKINSKIQNTIAPLFIIAFAVLLRLAPHPANVAPITGMALFGGAYLSRRYALIVPLAAMIISDYFLGFHSTMVYVYGSFILVGVIGIWLKERKSAGLVACSTLVSSVLFYLVTNFGVWEAGGLYPHTLNGLLESYTLALPFFRNTILGDLFFTGLFFGSFEFIARSIHHPSIQPENAR